MTVLAEHVVADFDCCTPTCGRLAVRNELDATMLVLLRVATFGSANTALSVTADIKGTSDASKSNVLRAFGLLEPARALPLHPLALLP